MYKPGDYPVPGYRLEKRLGRGGFGEVWSARSPGGVSVALKIIDLSSTAGLKEYRAVHYVKNINHPNLVPMHGYWLKDEDGNFHEDLHQFESMSEHVQPTELIIVMGLCEKNLKDRLRECKAEKLSSIPVAELLIYIEDAAKAIDHLNEPRHDLGQGPVAIQHCDIKPENILIISGAAQVCDFGLARPVRDQQSVTGAGGTFYYIAPEMLQGTPSRWTDQYSLALTWVHLRTGQIPVEGDNPGSLALSHMEGRIVLGDLPEAEKAVLRRATSLKPSDRFPTTRDMVRALRQAFDPTSVSASTIAIGAAKKKLDLKDRLRIDGEVVPGSGYKLVRFIGKGGYGEVWEALAPGGKQVALKVVPKLEEAAGKQEFRALELIKGLDHNHLMELHAFWVLDEFGDVIPDEVRHRPDAPPSSTLVIATRLASKNLLERLKECRKEGERGIPGDELLVYMRQAADAIDYLNRPHHKLGGKQVAIQHRDIKPENILVTGGGAVKVGDFSLAKVLEGDAALVGSDDFGLTLAYAAPEMFAHRVTRFSDQYSLAITYYHLRTGSLPFPSSESRHQIMLRHHEGRLDLTNLPPGERGIISRATRPQPDERYQSCLEMIVALERACHPIPDQTDLDLLVGDQSQPSTRLPKPSSFNPDRRLTDAPIPSTRRAQPGDPSTMEAVVENRHPDAGSAVQLKMPGTVRDPSAQGTDNKGSRTAVGLTDAGRSTGTGGSVTNLHYSIPVAVEPPTSWERLTQAIEPYRGRLLLLAAAVTLAVGVYGGLRFMQGLTDRDVRRLVQDGQFAAALDLFKTRGFLLRNKQDQLQQVVVLATGAMTDAGHYGEALELLRVEGSVLPDAGAKERSAVLGAWRGAVGAALNEDKLGVALSECKTILEAAPADAETEALRRQVFNRLGEKLSTADKTLDQNPRAALAFYDAVAGIDLLKEQEPRLYRRARLGQAQLYLRQKDLGKAEPLVKELMTVIKPEERPPLLKGLHLLTGLQRQPPEPWGEFTVLEMLADIQLASAADTAPGLGLEERRLIEQLKQKTVKAVTDTISKDTSRNTANVAKQLSILKVDPIGNELLAAETAFKRSNWNSGLTHWQAARTLAQDQKDEALSRKVTTFGEDLCRQSISTAYDQVKAAPPRLDAARELLAMAAALPAPQGEPARLRAVQTLVLARQPNTTDDDLGKAVKTIRELFEAETPPSYPVELAETLTALVDRKKVKPDEALAWTRSLARRPLAGETRSGVAAVMSKLVATRIQQRIPTAATVKDFEEILADCKDADDKDDFVAAARTEARLEQKPKPIRKGDAEQAAQGDKDRTFAGAQGYGRYVRALLDSYLKADARSGNSLADALANKSENWVSNYRLNRGAQRLHELGQDIGWDNADKAREASDLLEASWKLHEQGKLPITPELQVHRLLAAGGTAPVRWEILRPLTEEFRTQLTPERFPKQPKILQENAWPILVLAARVAEREGQLDIGLTCMETLFALREVREATPVERQKRELFDPAIDLGNKFRGQDAKPEADQRVARFYYEKGKLIRYNRHEFKTAEIDEAVPAFQAAVKLDAREPRYRIEAAYAEAELTRYNLPEEKWQKLLALAEKTEKDRPDYAGSYNLQAIARLYLSRLSRDNAERRKLLDEALANVNTAVNRTEKEDPEQLRFVYVLNRSMIHLELGNYEEDLLKRRALIHEAAKDGQQATRFNKTYQQLAYDAQGNALEDLAFLGGEEPEYYGKACDAFTNALNTDLNRAASLVNRGRCQYRWVALGGGESSKLESAATDLQRALELNPGENAQAECHFWLGKIALQRGLLVAVNQRAEPYKQARAEFQKTIELGEKLTPPEWAENAWIELIPLSWSEAAETFARKPKEVAPQLKEAKGYAERLRKSPAPLIREQGNQLLRHTLALEADQLLELPPASANSPIEQARGHAATIEQLGDRYEATRIRAECYSQEGKPAEAARTYDALWKEPKQEVTDAYLKFCLNRLDFVTAQGSAAPTEVEEADRLSLMAISPLRRAHALALASISRLRRMNQPGAATKFNLAQLEDEAELRFRLALRIDTRHDKVWFWQYGLSQMLQARASKVSATNANLQALYLKEARALLTEARGKAPASWKQRITTDLTKLK